MHKPTAKTSSLLFSICTRRCNINTLINVNQNVYDFTDASSVKIFKKMDFWLKFPFWLYFHILSVLNDF